MARITDELLPHESDGIQEYDNPLPLWWMALFVGTVLWASWYLPWYHLITDWSSAQRYEEEVAEAEARFGTPEALAARLPPPSEAVRDPARIERGAKIFATRCVSCHGKDAKGKVGPNLTDTEWIHGGTPEEIVHTITEGVLNKGMLSWKAVLGPDRILDVAAYVVSLGGAKLEAEDGGERDIPPREEATTP